MQRTIKQGTQHSVVLRQDVGNAIMRRLLQMKLICCKRMVWRPTRDRNIIFI